MKISSDRSCLRRQSKICPPCPRRIWTPCASATGWCAGFPDRCSTATLYTLPSRARRPRRTSARTSNRRKLSDGRNDKALVLFGEIIVERQSQKAVAEVLCNRALTRNPAETHSHFREVQWQVMEHAENSPLSQVSDQRLAEPKIRGQQIKHMERLFTMR